MKITAVQKPSGVSFDLISVSGNVLTINGKDYDLGNLAVRPEDDESFTDRFYLDASGEAHGVIYVGKYHFFAWVNNKMQKLFGFDDGIVTLEELIKYLDWHNELQAILDEYTEPLKSKKKDLEKNKGTKEYKKTVKDSNAVYAEREEKIRDLNKRWIEGVGK